MPDSSFVEQIRTEIQARIDALDPLVREAQNLQQTKDLLDGKTPPVRRSGRTSGGIRDQQALKEIVARPGQTSTEVARALGVHPNYMHRRLPMMANNGVIERRDDNGWYPVSK